jgi:hypothetical protein
VSGVRHGLQAPQSSEYAYTCIHVSKTIPTHTYIHTHTPHAHIRPTCSDAVQRFISLSTGECPDCLPWRWYSSKQKPSVHMFMFYRNIRRRGLLTPVSEFDEDQMYHIVNGNLVQDVMGRQLKRYMTIWHKLVADWYADLVLQNVPARTLMLGRHLSLAVDHHTQNSDMVETAVAKMEKVSSLFCLSCSSKCLWMYVLL